VWVEATAFDEMDLPVRALGQAVAVRASEDTARLEHTEIVDDGPPDVLAELVANVAHAAADAGFHWLEVDAEVRVPDDLGVLDDADHRRGVDLTTLA
jgi:hypothetical protein